jgi:hypothetical protein
VSLSRRVILFTSLAVGVIALLVTVLAYVLVRHELYRRLDLTLQERVVVLEPEVRSEVAGGPSLSVVAAPGELVQALKADGQVVLPPYQLTRLPHGPRELAVAQAATR